MRYAILLDEESINVEFILPQYTLEWVLNTRVYSLSNHWPIPRTKALSDSLNSGTNTEHAIDLMVFICALSTENKARISNKYREMHPFKIVPIAGNNKNNEAVSCWWCGAGYGLWAVGREIYFWNWISKWDRK